MELEFVFFPQIVEAFFTDDVKTLEKQVKGRLKVYFEVRERRLELTPGKLPQLEECLSRLKRLWNLEKVPLPFSLCPPGKSGLFRPGRIYLTPKEAQEFQKKLNKFPFSVALFEWQGFYELKIPATTYEEGLFPYRDILLLGPKKPCPLCGLRWHTPKSCPALPSKDAYKKILSWLKLKPQDFLKQLTSFFEGGKIKEGLKEASFRKPYLQPGFFYLLFTTNASTWENLPLKAGLASGGNLFLALEALNHGDFEEARQRLNTLDLNRDFRALLGLAYVNVLRGDRDEALYFLEKAHTVAERPLEQAYVLFLKGWVYELQHKNFEAEELYQEALKRDRTFWPARVHQAVCQVKYALNKARTSITPLLKETLALPTLLLEARFLPFAPELEEAAQAFYEEKQEEAVLRLAQAENTLRPIVKALPEEEVARFEEALAEIRKSIYEGGFLDLISAEKKAFDLGLELQGYLFRQTKRLRETYKNYQRRLERFENFWRQYPYRDSEDPYARHLKTVRQELEALAELLKGDPLRTLKKARQKSQKIEDLLTQLEEEKERIQKEWRFREQLSTFVKTFVFLEVIIFLIFLLVPALYHLLGAKELPPFFSLPSFLALSFLALLAALARSLGKKI